MCETNPARRAKLRRAGGLVVALLALTIWAGFSLSCRGPVTSPAASPVVGDRSSSAISAVTATRATPVASATAVITETPTTTPTSTSTPVPEVVVAVAESILSDVPAPFERLTADTGAVTLRRCGTSLEALHLWQRGEADAVVVRGRKPSPDAVALRSVPYVLVGFPGSVKGEFSLGELRHIYAGENTDWKGIVCGDGLSEAVLLGVDRLNPACVRYESPAEAMAHVASHEQSLAFLPWESVDFRVRLVSIDGHRLWREPLGRYPFVLRWWLAGDPGAEVIDVLIGGLAYSVEEPLSLSAVGDIMLGRYVGELIAQESPTYPFEDPEVRSILAGADLAFGNLECPVSERGTRQDKGIEFRAAPEVLEGLSHAGFDVISLANNHTGDYGDVARVDTLDALCGADILPVGAGNNVEEAGSPVVVDVKGMCVGFLAFNSIGPEWFAAAEDSPGSAWLDEAAVSLVRETAFQTDLLFVSCHWGTEYSAYPTSSQREMADALVEAGADLIIGHHPHVLQAVEYCDSGLVAYSLGNFVFDQFFSDQVRQGAILHCLADRSGLKSVELIPTFNVRARPRLSGDEDAAKVLAHIFEVSRAIDGFPSADE